MAVQSPYFTPPFLMTPLFFLSFFAATYFAFAGVGVVALGTIWTLVPETKGKTLEEIEAMWAQGVGTGGVSSGSSGGGDGPGGEHRE
jgi:hypothetical protein